MSKKKVLIVDDEEYIRRLISSILGKGYIVLEASNGEEAMHIARREKPDLVLMDIMMPKVDGYTACNAIKKDEETKGIPVVMLTGVNHELNKKLAEAICADGYLAKPFKRKDILDIVHRHIPTL